MTYGPTAFLLHDGGSTNVEKRPLDIYLAMAAAVQQVGKLEIIYFQRGFAWLLNPDKWQNCMKIETT